jgi:hypothetical protein
MAWKRISISYYNEGESRATMSVRELPFLVCNDFGIIPNSENDQTTEVQNILNAAATECMEWRPHPGRYVITQVTQPRGAYVRGVGTGARVSKPGSVFVQPKDFNGSMIKEDPTLPDNEWMHWGGWESCMLVKEPGGTATEGHAIDIAKPVGENYKIQNVHIEGFPESGIRYRRGGTPVWLRDIHVFRCGKYGIDLEKGPGDKLNCGAIDWLSGDDNGIALVHLKTQGDLSEHFSIKHVKAETRVAGKQAYVFHFEDIYQIGIHIEHVGGVCVGQGATTAQAIVYLTGNFTGRVHVKNAYIPGMKAVLKDMSNSAVPAQQNRVFPQVVAGGSFSYPMLYGRVEM